ncbi:uncharacterized protein LOC135477087 [Liolophura sinensis]|uniref:uncharacterized protein LOC135477087 n=1 Tax=Liolophura sinensis TaxID=3198878 RepID=UPI003159695F
MTALAGGAKSVEKVSKPKRLYEDSGSVSDGVQAYEDEVRGRHVGGALNKDLEKLFGDLRTDREGPEENARKPKAKTVKAALKLKPPALASKPKSLKAVKLAKAKSGARKSAKLAKKKKTVRKKCRENVSDKLFRQQFPKISWSQWYLAFSSERPDVGNWLKRSAGTKQGFRRKGHFTCNADGPRVFEVGVQVRPRGKIYATFVGKRSAPKSVSSWGLGLLSAPLLAKQVNAVLSGKVRVFVRLGKANFKGKKAQSSTVDKTQATAVGTYDYAWMKSRPNGKPRLVKKAGTKISYDTA